MHLKTFFQPKYFYQNLKKSKAILVLFLFLFPLILALSHLTNLVNGVVDFFSNNLFGNIMMFVYPITLSFLLFSFVFQKRKVDFMMSLPLSRKQIFITNTITGIFVILMTFILYICFLFLFAAFGHQMISFSYLVTYLLYMILGSLFLFLLTNLAISLAGNFLTTLVLILLLLLFFPVNTFLYRVMMTEPHRMVVFNDTTIKVKNYDDCEAYLGIKDCQKQQKNGTYYTDLQKGISTTHSIPIQNIVNLERYPAQIPSGIFLKTFLLLFVFFFLGVFAFQKRKMEHCETSFASFHLHSFVKSLTIVPIFFLLFLLDVSFQHIWLALLIIAAYFFLYDFITRKKVTHFALSLAYFGITFLFCLGCFQFLKYHLEKKMLPSSDSILETLHVEEITGLQFSFASSDAFNVLRGYDLSNITFQNKKIIKKFLSYAFSIPTSATYRETYAYTLLLKNGTYYRGYLYLASEDWQALKKMLQESQEFQDYLSVQGKQILTLSSNNQHYRLQELTTSLSSIQKVLKGKEYPIATNGTETLTVTLYRDQQHALETVYVPYQEAPNLANELLKKNNQHLQDILKTKKILSITTIENRTLRNTKIDSKNFEKMVSYIKNQDAIDVRQKYLKFYVTIDNDEMYDYYTNDFNLLKDFPILTQE